MIYFLYGPDDYSVHQRIKQLSESYAGVRNLTDETQLSELSHIQAATLFGEEYMIVVRDLVKKLTVEQLQGIAASLVVWEGEKIDRRQAVIKWLLKHATVEEYAPKSRQQIYAWVKEQGYTVAHDVLQLLWNRHQANRWAWSNELNKLSLFQGDTAITTDAARAIAAATIEENIFEFVDVFGERKTLLSFVLLENLLASDTDPFYLHSMLARQVRLLMLAQEPNGLSGQPPFVIGKLQTQQKYWTSEELAYRHQELVEMDYAAKTGQADIVDELIRFVLTEKA